MPKKISFLCLLTALLVSFSIFAACSNDDDDESGSGDSISPIKLVPQKADTLGYANLSEIVDDDDIMALYGSIPLDTNQAFQTLSTIMEEVGRGLQQAVIFAGTSSLSQIADDSEAAQDNGYSAIIIKGEFKQSTLIDAIENDLEETLAETDYNGVPLHSTSSGQTGMAFVGKDGLIIGTMPAIKDAIDVMEGDQPAVSGEILNSYNDLEGDLLKVVVMVPQETAESNFEMPEIPLLESIISPETVKDLQTVSLTLDKKGDLAPLAIELCFAGTDSAENIRALFDMIPELVNMGMNMGMIPPEIQPLLSILDDIEANVSGTCVDISMELPLSDMGGILDLSDSLSLPL